MLRICIEEGIGGYRACQIQVIVKYGTGDSSCNPPNVLFYVSSLHEQLLSILDPPDKIGDEFDGLQCYFSGQQP